MVKFLKKMMNVALSPWKTTDPIDAEEKSTPEPVDKCAYCESNANEDVVWRLEEGEERLLICNSCFFQAVARVIKKEMQDNRRFDEKESK